MRKVWHAFLILHCSYGAVAQTPAARELQVADSLYALGNYARAINAYAAVSSKSANLQIARAYRAIGNYDKAIAQYEQLTSEDSTMQIARFELGKLLLKTGRFDTGRKLFTDLVKRDGSNAEYHYYLGLLHEKMDQTASSLVAFRKAVSIDSTHLRSLFKLGKYHTVQQERDAALKYVDQGLRLYGNDVAMINLKALILYNDHQFENAVPWFERVLGHGEEKRYVYLKLAHCYQKNWQFDKAKDTYTKLLSMDNTDADAYFGLGTVHQNLKQLDSAEVAYKKAIAVQQPSLIKEYNVLAMIARERNDLKTALEYYQKAYAEDTTNETAYFQICTVADQYYKDPEIRLGYYRNFQKKFGTKTSYASSMVERRSRELKEEIHFGAKK
ncbi:tetratricopeptide repeat protein [Maribacter sp. 2-571]|uniref:tetratricopeptide repeat protein n=1 Tax=Maribacter sp. 2-571 TaxID=3417569 RepID=UPI003D347B27